MVGVDEVDERGTAPFAIHYLNLDNFKEINDALGHPKGDELLAAVAIRLAKEGRRAGDVASFGGNEFAVLQMDVSEPSVAGALATKNLEALSRPYDLGTDVHATASIGVAVYNAQVTGPNSPNPC